MTKVKHLITALTMIAAVALVGHSILVAAASTTGIWISASRLASLPTSGVAWEALLSIATTPAVPGNPTLIDQNSTHSRSTMATALVAARLDSDVLRGKVRDAIRLVKGTENSTDFAANRLLQLGRNLPGYVIAADLIGLRSFDPAFDSAFRTWISALRTRVFSGTFGTIANADEHDPANWGAYDGAARAAIAAYLGDTADLARSAAAFKSFVSGPNDGRWVFRPDAHDMSWQCSYPETTGYTPVDQSCTRDGHNLDGVMAQDMARGGTYQWPPTYTSYPRENLTGRTIQAEILFRAGYTDVYDWGERGLLRVAQALRRLDAVDGRWFDQTQLVHRIIATRYAMTSWGLSATSRGRAVSGVDWTSQPTSTSALIDVVTTTTAAATSTPAPTPAPRTTTTSTPSATATPSPTKTPKPTRAPKASATATPTPTESPTPSKDAGKVTAPGQQKKPSQPPKP